MATDITDGGFASNTSKLDQSQIVNTAMVWCGTHVSMCGVVEMCTMCCVL